MPSEDSAAAYEIAHVLFLDIVAYSLQPIDRQTDLLTLLQKLVLESAEFQRARDQHELISLPTGDGMGLVFLRDPLSPVKCAIEIAGSLQQHPELHVRMGIHTGPVKRHADIREGANVVGGGINMAQRVMDCGDPGHILLSRNIAEVLEQFSDWRECLDDLGVQEVKHGVKVHLYNFVKDPAGNPETPSKLISPDGAAAGLAEKAELPLWRRSEAVRRAIRFTAVFVVACVLTPVFEGWLDRGIASGDSANVAQATFTFSGLYQKIVVSPRNPIPRNTAIVKIDPENDPGSVGVHDLCGQRKMMPVLLSRIADAKPRVIVIDKFFGETSCPGTINQDLIAAISKINATIPLVVGRIVVDDSSLYLQTSLFKDLPELRDGIVNLDRDTRKLPLRWKVYGTKAGMERDAGLAWRETLALMAAEVYENGELDRRHPDLAMLDPGSNPYISFLNRKQFAPYSFLAGFVLCGHDVAQGENTAACEGSPRTLGVLSGKIVLVGEIIDQDRWATVVGNLPGVYLHANFIEALLDDRYYLGSTQLDYTFAFLFLAGLEIILVTFRHWTGRLGAIGLLALTTLFVLFIVIPKFHRYVNPVPFVAMALLIRGLATNVPYFRESTSVR